KASVLVLERVAEPARGGPLLTADKPLWPERSRLRLEKCRYELTAFRGSDGRPEWTWKGKELGAGEFDPRWGAEGEPADLEGIGPAVCLHLQESEKTAEQVILDGSGKVRRRRRVDLKEVSNLSPCDLDGDGKDELLAIHKGRLRATSGGWDKVLWERALPG